jgi:hypothetical protein
MPQSCRHTSDAIRKILFARAPSLSSGQLNEVMRVVRALRKSGPLYRESFSKKLRELEHADKITSYDRHAIISALFAD